jgi:hypothetical protein
VVAVLGEAVEVDDEALVPVSLDAVVSLLVSPVDVVSLDVVVSVALSVDEVSSSVQAVSSELDPS